MARAIALAAQGRATSQPNPSVGCVIVRDGEIVGEGFHARAGEAHAEPQALAQAGERASGSVMYVTLEPCAHHGRTPPCVDAVIAAGVRKVCAALTDPNPQVAGGGLAKLRAAGIDVETGLLCDEAERVLAQVDGHVKTAVVIILGGVDADTARARLQAASGFVRPAIAGETFAPEV